MNNIRLKLTAISPIHIGSGEVYEPINFIIDGNILYEFRDEDFFMALPDIKRKAFMQIIEDNKSDSFARLHGFVKDNKDIAKKVAHLQVRVTDGLQKEYNKVVGKIRQFEGRAGNYSRVFNRFEIQRIQRKQVKAKNGYAHIGYIVGSSLKGAISTAYQEYTYKKEGEKALKSKFQAIGRDIHKNIFKEFKVSDSIVTKVGTKIGFALNKERFDYDFNNPQNNLKLSTYIEVINPKSEFIVDINYGSLNIKEILESCNSHYLPIFKSILSNETNGKEEFINEYLEDSFYDTYRHFKLKDNQYLIRVGKHSGARAVTIDGLREIKSKISGGGRSRKPNKWETLEEETTSWLFGENPNKNSGLLPFGWLLCEVL
jgi:CRISPR-associated protein Csm5